MAYHNQLVNIQRIQKPPFDFRSDFYILCESIRDINELDNLFKPELCLYHIIKKKWKTTAKKMKFSKELLDGLMCISFLRLKYKISKSENAANKMAISFKIFYITFIIYIILFYL